MKTLLPLPKVVRALLASCAVASLAVVGIAPVAQAADPTETISGTVTWADGSPMADAEVNYATVVCGSDSYTDEDENSTFTQPDGSFSFATYPGSCYEVHIHRNDYSINVSVDGAPADHWVYLESGDTGLSLQADTDPPITVSVTIPGWTASQWDSSITFYRQYIDDDGEGGLYAWWDNVAWSDVPSNGQFTVELNPGATYSAVLWGDDHYYSQYAGGTDCDTYDWPLDVQTLTIAATASSATWSPTFKKGSVVTGTVSLDGERAWDVQVELVRADDDGYRNGVNGVDVASNGSFSVGGLAPGASYTLKVRSDKHVDTWLGGYAGQDPSWDKIKGSVFKAVASGGTVTGKNIALTVKAGFLRATAAYDLWSQWAVNAATGERYSFDHDDIVSGNLVARANVTPGVYLVAGYGSTWNDVNDEWGPYKTGSQVVAVGAAKTVAAALTNRAFDYNDAGITAVAVSGAAKVGSTLTAAATTKNADSTPSYAFYWTDGVSILGTGKTYTPKPADAGKVLYAFVVVTVTGAYADIATAPTAKVVPASGTAQPNPKPTPPNPIQPPSVALTLNTGGAAPTVGQALSAPAVPTGWTATYQWLSNGEPIPGATGPTYKLTSRDAGKRIQVRLTLTRPGAKTQVQTTKPVTVAKIKPTVKAKLLKSGKVRVTVKAKGISKPTGKIKIKFGKVAKTYKLKATAKGKLTVAIPKKVKAGRIKVKATYNGNAQIAKKTAKTIKVTVK